MDEQSQRDLKMLTSKRWDPRRGVGRRLGTLQVWLTSMFLLFIVFGRYLFIMIGGHPAWGFAFLLPALGLILCWLIPIGIRRRTKRRAAEHDGFLCPWCRYALTGLPDAGTCPECGAGYERSLCMMLYQSVYRSYQPDQHVLAKRDREAWTKAIELREGIFIPSSTDNSDQSPASDE